MITRRWSACGVSAVPLLPQESRAFRSNQPTFSVNDLHSLNLFQKQQSIRKYAHILVSSNNFLEGDKKRRFI